MGIADMMSFLVTKPAEKAGKTGGKVSSMLDTIMNR